MEFSSSKIKMGAAMSRAVTPDFDNLELGDTFNDDHFSKARVSLSEYALLAALLVVLIAGVIATTSTQIGNEILALL